MNSPQLGAVLLSRGFITGVQLEQALKHHDDEGCRLGEAVLALGFCSEAQIARALADQLGMPFADLEETPPRPGVLQLVPRSLAQQYGVVPVQRQGGRLLVVARNPLDFSIDAVLRQAAGMPVIIACGVDSQITRVLEHYEQLSCWESTARTPGHLRDLRARLDQRDQVRQLARARGNPQSLEGANLLLRQQLERGAVEIQIDLEQDVLCVHSCDGDQLVPLAVLPRRVVHLVIVRPEDVFIRSGCTTGEVVSKADEQRAAEAAGRRSEQASS
jgi:hypothetical protein